MKRVPPCGPPVSIPMVIWCVLNREAPAHARLWGYKMNHRLSKKFPVTKMLNHIERPELKLRTPTSLSSFEPIELRGLPSLKFSQGTELPAPLH